MPFGKYRDFNDCVRQNSDKRDPEAYCAAVERAVREHKRTGKRSVKVHPFGIGSPAYNREHKVNPRTGMPRA